ncbi:MAG: sulfatase [Haloferula sp.]
MKTKAVKFVSLLCALAATSHAESPAKQPNIILFLVDDMGWTDCGAYGSKYYETPNVDRLAAESMRFTQAYAHPLCSPSRASIMTGQEEARHGITSAHGHLEPEPWGPQVYQENPSADQPFLLPKSRRYLDPKAITLAEALKFAGYRTGHLGKWHLGLTKPHWPEAHGFETTFHAAPDPGPPGSTYFSPHGVHPDGHPSGKRRVGNITDGPDGEHIADRLAQEAIKFIKAHKNEPFFLNLCEYPVHGPWEAKEEDIKYFKEKKDPTGQHTNPVMAAMLKAMDDSLGQVLTALDELGLADNTIVVFFSDNGGNVKSWSTAGEQDRYLKNPKHNLHHMVKAYREHAGLQPPTNNGPLRMGKAFLYEGGARVPLMVRWPDSIKAGGTSDAIINNIDLYPTLLELAGVPLPEDHVVDGLSFAPVLLEGAEFPRDTSFSWFPYHDAGIAVRKGDWKLIRRFKENPDYYEGMVELYDLKNDLGETTNLAEKMPEKVAELGKLIDAHFKETGGLYPKPNPKYRKPVPKSATHGLVPKQCRIDPIEGGIRVVPRGKQPFLGTAQVQLTGPLTLQLRARGVGGAGGKGRIQWRTKGQDEFPKSGQNIAFDLPAGTEWQEVTVPVPVEGRSHLVRLHLPGAKALEVQSIRWEAKGEKAVEWQFSEE